MSIRCYKCGSKNVQVEVEKDKSYSIGKGLVGTALFGTGGAVMGVNGKVTEHTKYICRACGYTESFCMNPSISERIDNDIAENNASFLRITKQHYPNIEWEEQKIEKKSYEEIRTDNEVKVHNYCKDHFYEPIYASQISSAIGISIDDCISAVNSLYRKGLLNFHPYADVKENDDIPYKYCTDLAEIEKNFLKRTKEEERRIQEQRQKREKGK